MPVILSTERRLLADQKAFVSSTIEVQNIETPKAGHIRVRILARRR